VLFRKNEQPVLSASKIETTLGANTSFNGTCKSDGNLRVDGMFQGQIETAGNVIIGPSAKVQADIVANSVQIWGAVKGNVSAQGRLEILSTGRVWGDIHVASLLIDDGGVFRGQCFMVGENGAISLLESPAGEAHAPNEIVQGPSKE
jgi:cytoskeletal protein CcmA (bactofilin family)